MAKYKCGKSLTYFCLGCESLMLPTPDYNSGLSQIAVGLLNTILCILIASDSWKEAVLKLTLSQMS